MSTYSQPYLEQLVEVAELDEIVVSADDVGG